MPQQFLNETKSKFKIHCEHFMLVILYCTYREQCSDISKDKSMLYILVTDFFGLPVTIPVKYLILYLLLCVCLQPHMTLAQYL